MRNTTGLELHRARRKAGETGQLDAAEVARVLAAYELERTIKGASRRAQVSRRTVERCLDLWNTSHSLLSPKRHNSGRPRTATALPVVAAVAAELKAVHPGAYVPTAAGLKRKLKLPFSERSVRNAAKEAGYTYRSKRRRPFLSVLHRTKRLAWAKRMLKAGHDWRRTICTDEKWVVLEEKQRRCWIKDGRTSL